MPPEFKSVMRKCVYPLRVEFIAPDGGIRIVHGTCIAVEPQGTFLTAAHVVAPVSKNWELHRVHLRMSGGDVPCTIRKVRNDLDCAILSANGYKGGTVSLSVENSIDERELFLCGFPVKYSGTTFPELIVTRGRLLDSGSEYAEIDHPVLRLKGTSDFGGSGSAVVDEAGRVHGMVIASVFDKVTDVSTRVYAIPAKALLQVIKAYQAESRPADGDGGENAVDRSVLDSDGDGIADTEDREPWIADVPDVELSVRLVQVGCEIKRDVSEWGTTLDEHDSSRLNSTREEVDQDFSFRSQTRFAPSLDPVMTLGSSRSTIQRETGFHRTYRFHQERVEEVVQQIRRARKSGRSVGPQAGFLKIELTARNRNAVPCQLTDFGINVVRTGGNEASPRREIWQTFFAGNGTSNFRGPLDLSHGPSTVVLKFEGLNTDEVLRLLDGGLQSMELEIPAGTVQLDRVDFRRPFPRDAVLAKCAVVTIDRGDELRRFHVSVEPGKENVQQITALELLRRLPGQKEELEIGPSVEGGHLAQFFGRRGLPLFLPHIREWGRWFVLHSVREPAGASRSRDITHGLETAKIRPGDHVELHYVSSREYWKPAERWRGYVASYADLRRVLTRELDFWRSFGAFEVLDSAAVARIQKDAEQLAKEYDEFFRKHAQTDFARYHYSDARQRIENFRAWFDGGDSVHLPEFTFRLTSTRVWWNVPEVLSPSLVLRHADKEGGTVTLSKDRFKSDQEKSSGALVPLPEDETAFTWRPFQPVEVKLTQNGGLLFDKLLVYNRWTGYQAAARLLEEQELTQLEDAEPDVSGAQLYFEIMHGPQVVRPQEFRDYLRKLEPRVLRVVPSFELVPDIRALSLWQEYDPRAHYQSAVLFEELYQSCREPDECLNYLVRAIYTSFLSFQFGRCAKLGEQIPPDQEVTQAMLAHLPPGNGLEYFRRLAKAAKVAAELEETAPEYHALAGVILRWHNLQRFDHLIRYPKDCPPEMGAEDFREWRQALTKGLAEDRKRIEAIGSDSLQSFLAERIERFQQRLAEPAPDGV